MTLNRIRLLILAMISAVVMLQPAHAADYAREISAFRQANKLSPVVLDSSLNAFALTQAQAMSASGKVSHEVGGVFSVRVAKLRKIARAREAKAAENIAAGFLTFSETLKQWEDSPGHRENLLMPGAHRVGVAYVANPKSPYRMFWAMVITD
jgi:uncharacterized protein YkwD